MPKVLTLDLDEEDFYLGIYNSIQHQLTSEDIVKVNKGLEYLYNNTFGMNTWDMLRNLHIDEHKSIRYDAPKNYPIPRGVAKLITLLSACRVYPIILCNELEHHIPLLIQPKLLSVLRSMNGGQIIFTTNSPELVQSETALVKKTLMKELNYY